MVAHDSLLKIRVVLLKEIEPIDDGLTSDASVLRLAIAPGFGVHDDAGVWWRSRELRGNDAHVDGEVDHGVSIAELAASCEIEDRSDRAHRRDEELL